MCDGEKPSPASADGVEAPAAPEIPVTPSPTAVESKGFDWANYSVTIGLGVTFAVVKALTYLGVLDLS